MAIIKYETKPVVVEAVQWTGDNIAEMDEVFGRIAGLDSLEVGHFIKRNQKGRLEVLSEDAFYATHKRHLVWEDNI